VSDLDDIQDEKPKRKEPQPTVAWDPDDVPGLSEAAGGGADDGVESAAEPDPVEEDPPAVPSGQQSTMVFDPAKMGLADDSAEVLPPPQPLTSLPDTPSEEVAGGPSDQPTDDPLLGTLIRGKWRVLNRLGAGSFGTVYKVQDEKGGWIEALKILGVDRLTGAEADVARKRFLREAQIMKRLGTDSQHIVGLSTYEEDLEAGLIYFLMEMVDGGSLADALEREGPFAVARTIRLALQICDALMAAHEGPEGVVHRDLKLDNLMLTTDRAGDEMLKVLDFGIAKLTEKEVDSRLTSVGTLGTPGYAAPEQLRAEDVDARTDLFAFGVILYALVTGLDPWLGLPATESTDRIYDLMVATERSQVRPMAETGVAIPPAMEHVIMKLLRREPDHRFQSARALADALKRVAAGGEVVDAGSLRILTEEPGVEVEIRSGRKVLAQGPTPCLATGIPAGTYRVVIRDARYEPLETDVELAAGAMEDRTLVTTLRGTGVGASVARHRGMMVAAVLVLAIVGATAVVRPWGRTLALDDLVAQVGSVSDVRLGQGGVLGSLAVGPISVPFLVQVTEEELPVAVSQVREAGITVDTSWEVARLIGQAVQAQGRSQYFGADGQDVLSYSRRMTSLDPESSEARSLLLKVAERMAWEADAARADGEMDRAADLVQECYSLVPDHAGCAATAHRP